MQILVINQYGQSELICSEVIPRIGDKVDLFEGTLPTVASVVLWPSERLLKNLTTRLDIDAIVAVN